MSLIRSYTEISIIILIFIVALIPRVLDLGTFLTADEKNWIDRSNTFIHAAADGRISDMMLTAHPGVTTMWAVGTSIMLKTIKDGVSFEYDTIIHFIKAGQLPIALMGALLAPLVYFLVRQLFSEKKYIALFSGLFIALNPYLIGHTRVVHVDGLLIVFVFLSILATILYVHKEHAKKWLVLSAILAALSILTKAPGIFPFLFLPFSMLIYGGSKLRDKAYLFKRLKDMGLWILVVFLTVIIVWPTVIWPSSSGETLSILQQDVGGAIASPHNVKEEYTLDFTHYPLALLTRTTPLILLFATIYIVIFAANWEKMKRFDKRSLLLICYVILFVLMMSIGAKKGDRYILPVFPALDVLASLGLVSLSYFVIGINKLRKRISLILGSITTISLLLTVIFYHPYAISYANPLFPDNLSQEIGWGEGLEKVGLWLNENDPNATVASWYPKELQPFTTATVAHIEGHDSPTVRYVVLYRNMFGRADDYYATKILEQYHGIKEPVHTVKIVGKEFAWVYEKEAYESIAAELYDEVRVGQLLSVPRDYRGLELLLVTYSGQATEGNLILNIREDINGDLINSFEVPVSHIEDGKWHRVHVPDNIETDKVFVEVYVQGIEGGRAPGIRYTDKYSYGEVQAYISTDEKVLEDDKRDGQIAVRWW